MMKAERQELILKRVADSGRVVVTDLAKEMGVTETTLRKDLQELDDWGAVQRVHGGAIKPFRKPRRPWRGRQKAAR